MRTLTLTLLATLIALPSSWAAESSQAPSSEAGIAADEPKMGQLMNSSDVAPNAAQELKAPVVDEVRPSVLPELKGANGAPLSGELVAKKRNHLADFKSGHRMKQAGIALTALGITASIGSLGAWGLYAANSALPVQVLDQSTVTTASIGITAAAGALLAIGIPLWAAGSHRQHVAQRNVMAEVLAPNPVQGPAVAQAKVARLAEVGLASRR